MAKEKAQSTSENATVAKLKKLDILNALTPGADVWIVPDLGVSSWSRKIDWYLNLQLMRAEPKKPTELCSEMREVAQKWDFDVPVAPLNPLAPLMVVSDRLLPNHQTILVPVGEDGQWPRRCHRVWLNLGRPSLRIFLPDHQGVETFTQEWSALASPVDFGRDRGAEQNIEIVAEFST
jgi:hypothetical protein